MLSDSRYMHCPTQALDLITLAIKVNGGMEVICRREATINFAL